MRKIRDVLRLKLEAHLSHERIAASLGISKGAVVKYQIHRAGEKLFVDYADPAVKLVDGTRAHIFAAALGASSYTFACATPRETMADRLEGCARAPSFIGGVPQLIVPDNPRAMVANPNRYEPRANNT